MFFNKKTPRQSNVVIAEGAVIAGEVVLTDGVNIWYNAVLSADEGCIRIGQNTNIQDLCLLHGDIVIGEGCTIGHKADLRNVTIGDNTLVGMGSVILDGTKIGKNCLIAAGSFIPEHADIPDNSFVLGNPAKILRSLTPEEISENHASAEKYLHLAEKYRLG